MSSFKSTFSKNQMHVITVILKSVIKTLWAWFNCLWFIIFLLQYVFNKYSLSYFKLLELQIFENDRNDI